MRINPAKMLDNARTFVNANCPDLVALLDRETAQKVHNIFADMSARLIRWGTLSEKQIAFARKLFAEYQQRQNNGGKTDREVQWDKEKEAAQDCPQGRTQVVGTVLSAKWKETQYGTTLKITVKDDRGFVVWMSCPSSIQDPQKGDRISVIVDVTVSDNDSKFGFGKRPTKGTLLATNRVEFQPEPMDDGKAVYHGEYQAPYEPADQYKKMYN